MLGENLHWPLTDFYMFRRLLGTSQSVNPDFKINETSNANYELCRSYPQVILTPAHFANENLGDVAEFRSSGRIPGVVWVTPEGSVALARSSQVNLFSLFNVLFFVLNLCYHWR